MQDTKVGELHGSDNEHPASGNVSLTKEALKLENFDISQAPDARLILTTNFDEPTGIRIGPLKNFTGTDDAYSIPEGTDLSTIDSIVVWCDKFNVSIGSAKLA